MALASRVSQRESGSRELARSPVTQIGNTSSKLRPMFFRQPRLP